MLNSNRSYAKNVSSHELLALANDLFIQSVEVRKREAVSVNTVKPSFSAFIRTYQEMLCGEYEEMECYCSFVTYCKIRYKWFYK
jgi:hypothetical protein